MSMTDLEFWVAMAGALGVGGITPSVVNAFLNRQKNQIDTNYAIRNEIRQDLDKARTRLDMIDRQNEGLIVENAKLQGQVMVLTGQIETLRSESLVMNTEIRKLRQEAGSSESESHRLERDMIKLQEEMRQMRDENFALATKMGLYHDENRMLRSVLDRNGIQSPELQRSTDRDVPPS